MSSVFRLRGVTPLFVTFLWAGLLILSGSTPAMAGGGGALIKLLRATERLISASDSGRDLSRSRRIDLFVNNPHYRTRILMQMQNQKLASELGDVWARVRRDPKYQLVINREIRLAKALDKVTEDSSLDDASLELAQNLFREILDEVPVEKFGSKSQLEAAMREVLLEKAGTSPKFALKRSTGELTFRSASRGEIQEHPLDAYRLIFALSAIVVCDAFDCVGRFFDGPSREDGLDGDYQMTESQVREEIYRLVDKDALELSEEVKCLIDSPRFEGEAPYEERE